MSNDNLTGASRPKIFWAMQYTDPSLGTYQECSKLLANKYEILTPPSDLNQTSIVKKVITQIYDADFVIVDVSTIAYAGNKALFNGNVMFELGYAMTLAKKVIMISCTSFDDLPFDLKAYNVEPYTIQRPITLCERLQAILDSQTVFENPITDVLGSKLNIHQNNMHIIVTPKQEKTTASRQCEQSSATQSSDTLELSSDALRWLVAIHQNQNILYQTIIEHKFWNRRKYTLRAGLCRRGVNGESPVYGWNDMGRFDSDMEEIRTFFEELQPYLFNKDEVLPSDHNTHIWYLTEQGQAIAQAALQQHNN